MYLSAEGITLTRVRNPAEQETTMICPYCTTRMMVADSRYGKLQYLCLQCGMWYWVQVEESQTFKPGGGTGVEGEISRSPVKATVTTQQPTNHTTTN